MRKAVDFLLAQREVAALVVVMMRQKQGCLSAPPNCRQRFSKIGNCTGQVGNCQKYLKNVDKLLPLGQCLTLPSALSLEHFIRCLVVLAEPNLYDAFAASER